VFIVLEKLKKTLEESPIIKKGEYNYFVHPVTDGIPLTQPEVLKEIAVAIKNHFHTDVDKIVCIEAMGIHLATALSLETGIPFVVVRKRQYGLPGEVAVHQTTGYSQGELFINGINSGDKVLVIDDVVSTGGTMIAVLQALKNMGVEIAEVVAVIEKGEGKKIVEKETGLKLKALIKVDVIDNKVTAEPILK
jgi:adenine phosphoribosyltransferase